MITANVLSGPWIEPFAEASFQSILGLVDEIIVIDSSPGNNPNDEVNRKYATKIIDVPGGGTKDFNFSLARQLAMENSKNDWNMKWDQDEVLHEKDIENLYNFVSYTTSNLISAAFYHFMVYPWLYQYIGDRTLLYRKSVSKWDENVHEQVFSPGKTLTANGITTYHYGYLRGQEEVFKRWKLYAEIVDKPNWYNGQDPANIITDRISTCQNFTGTHPKVVEHVFDQMFPYWRELV